MAATRHNQYWQLRTAHGRLQKLSPDEFWQKACDYFEWVDKHPYIKHVRAGERIIKIKTAKPYSMRGMALFMGVSLNTLRNYGKREDFLHLYTRARAVIYDHNYCGAVVGAFNARVIAYSLFKKDHKIIKEHPAGAIGVLALTPGEVASISAVLLPASNITYK